LRRFARLDESERKKADLHEGIDNTLTLLGHKLRERIEVIRNYGDLPSLECYPNRLNQVFMNLLVNAIQAIDDGGRITITTCREGDDAVLRFADTGSGIRGEDIEHIFDPGFTTKGVIQEHQGRIEVSSEPGKGSLFTIRLPISPGDMDSTRFP
jgi:signal transduction histidine kinase